MDAQGIAFIARDVAIVCDRDANALRILHVTEDGSFRLLTHDPDHRDQNRFALERPFGIATLWRFDEHEPDSADVPVAVVAVTEYDKTSLLILLILQDNDKHDEVYSVTRGFRIFIGGSAMPTSSLVLRSLRGVAAVAVRKVGIGVLRSRRKAAIESAEADSDEDAIETARQTFARDSNKSFMVYVTRDASGEARVRSDVVALDLAPLLKHVLMGSPEVDGISQEAGDSAFETLTIRGSILAHLGAGERAGPVTVDANGLVCAAEAHRVIKCLGANASASTAASATAFVEGEAFAGDTNDGAWWPGAQPRDGIASQATFGHIGALAVDPCGRTLFGIDNGRSDPASSGVHVTIFKVAHLCGLSKWFSAWRSQTECFGERDPTMKDDAAYRTAKPRLWHEMLPELERSAAEIDAISQKMHDATGRDHLNGSHLMMETRALKAQTQYSVPSMRAVHSLLEAIDNDSDRDEEREGTVADKLDPRTVTEHETELWWALVRRHIDSLAS